ncbi:MAG: hypothetical protein IPL78_19335 [Chloroflexi bacterium]|nr:hypothetical protein [Chloroflexota bacterium]
MSDEADDDVEYNQAMLAEEMAYRALHPHLLEKFRGKHVAIFEGELVDYDDDSVALYQRMRQKYPGKFVLMTPVQAEAVERATRSNPGVGDAKLNSIASRDV